MRNAKSRMMLSAFIYILLAYLLTVIGVEGWRRIALRRQILDVPNERSSHLNPTPRGGGIVIFIVTTIFLMISAGQSNRLSDLLPFFAGAFLIAIVSWLDDLYSLPSWLRLSVHTIAATLIILEFGSFTALELPFYRLSLQSWLIGQIFTLIWIVGLTNAYNFMDGIDGIAGAEGVVAGTGWSVAGWLAGEPLIMIFGGLLAATTLGFLWHNWHPARIFMGDVGAAFLGFSFAVLPILAMRSGADKSGGRWTIIGVLFVWAFVFDASLTFIRRAMRGENVFAAHRSHFYQRLVIAGWRHDTVTIYYGAASLIGAGLALLWLKF